ncbi:hypothetical protein H4Q26_004995 [Puccinia striiformis f. sp. tritici PST-130]|nr:hypothetical protein H4Q26_004995 [Puccinia striiformis f. sp. tritici PST-130]
MTSINLPLGISIGLLASFIQSLGLTIQRKSHLQNDRLPLSSRKPDYLRPVWLIGFTIYFSFNILGSIFQIGTLPLIILGPLGAISLLWNAILARLLLADTFSIHLIFGTILIGLEHYSSSKSSSSSSLLDHLLIRTSTRVPSQSNTRNYLTSHYLTHLTPPTTQLQSRSSSTNSQSNNHNNNDHSFTASHLQSNNNNSNSNKRHHQQSRLSRTIYHPSGSPLLQLSSIDNKDENGGCDHELLSNQKIDRLKLLIGIAYGSTSGTLSGICLLFAKTVNEFAKIQTWLILFVLLVSALLQLWYLNKALRLVNPTLICPLAFCFYNLSSIISSLVYYDQLKLLSNFQIFAISTKKKKVELMRTRRKKKRKDHHNENEATPLLPSSSKIGGGHSSEEEEEEEQELSEEYTEDSIGMDDATSSLKPEDHRRPSYNNSRRNTYSFILPLPQPLRQLDLLLIIVYLKIIVEEDPHSKQPILSITLFDSSWLMGMSLQVAIRPKKRLARKSGDGYLIGRSSLSRHSHERDLYHHHHLSHQSSPAQRQQQQQPEQEQEDHEEEQPNQEQQTQDGHSMNNRNGIYISTGKQVLNRIETILLIHIDILIHELYFIQIPSSTNMITYLPITQAILVVSHLLAFSAYINPSN